MVQLCRRAQWRGVFRLAGAGIGVFEHRDQTPAIEAGQRRRLDRGLCRLGDSAPGHAQLLERERSTRGARQPLHAEHRIDHAKRSRDRRHGFRSGLALEAHHVWKQHRVRRRVRQIEQASEHVTELVVQPGARVGESRSGEIRAFQGRLTRVAILWRAGQTVHAAREQPQSFFCREPGAAIDVVVPERFRRVRHRVPQARHGDVAWQRQGQLRVVDHECRAHALVATGLLPASGRDAVDRGHLRSGIRGRDRDDPYGGAERNSLGQSDGRAASVGHHGVGFRLRHSAQCFFHHLGGDVLAGDGKRSSCPISQTGCQPIRGGLLAGRADDHDAVRTELLELVRNPIQRTCGENHAGRAALHRKSPAHCRPPSLW